MKKSKLEKMIRQDFESLVPEQPPKVNLGDYFSEHKQESKPRFKLNLSRHLVGIMAVLVFGLFIFIFDLYPGALTTTDIPITTTVTTSDVTGTTISDTSTTASNTTSSAVVTTSPDGNPITELSADEYASGIITASRLYLNLYSSDASSLMLEETVSSLLVDEYIDLMSKYLNVMETSIGNAESYDAIIETSDRIEYAFSLTSSGLNLVGDSETYKLYYNVENVSDTEFDMTGIMVWGVVESVFTGHLEVEEGEKKLVITTYDDSTPDDYVETEMKIETGEHKYEMRAYVGGVLSIESSVEIEVSATESKVSVSILKDSDEIEFEIKREIEDEEAVTEIEYEITSGLVSESGSIIVNVTYDDINGTYVYEFDLTSGEVEKSYEEDRFEDDDFEVEDESLKLDVQI